MSAKVTTPAKAPEPAAAPILEDQAPPRPQPIPYEKWVNYGDPFDVIASIPESEWSLYRVYVYRREPSINPAAKNDGPNLFTADEPFSLDDLKRDHGSGVYKIRLKGRYDPSIDYHRQVTIYDKDHPPRIGNDDWQRFPENARWIFRAPAEHQARPAEQRDVIGDLRQMLDLLRTQQPQQSGPNLEPYLERVSRLEERLLEAMLHRPDQASELLRMHEVTKALTPPPAPRDEVTPKLMEKLLEVAFARPAAEAAKSETERMRETLALMRELKQESGGNQESPWAALAPQVGQVAAALVTLGAQFFASRGQQAPPQPAAAPPQPGQPAPTAVAQQTTQPPAGDEDPMFAQIFPHIAAPLATHLQDPECGGGDFAAWVINGYGAQVLKMAQSLSAAKLEAGITASPMWPALQVDGVTADRLRAFIGEFLAWDGDDLEPPAANNGGAA